MDSSGLEFPLRPWTLISWGGGGKFSMLSLFFWPMHYSALYLMAATFCLTENFLSSLEYFKTKSFVLYTGHIVLSGLLRLK
jgi:hypothetical protein